MFAASADDESLKFGELPEAPSCPSSRPQTGVLPLATMALEGEGIE
jgi:hypothetical protein